MMLVVLVAAGAGEPAVAVDVVAHAPARFLLLQLRFLLSMSWNRFLVMTWTRQTSTKPPMEVMTTTPTLST